MGEMHGARRVVTFCLLTAVLPTVLLIIPLYLRHSVYADVSYAVAESDVLEAVEGISTVFCQEQILKMNSTFRAFQLQHMPALSNRKKRIQLKKSMVLPDDTVEYWGFYLLAGSNISLSACSRFEGAGVLVVRGEKTLRTCSLTEPNLKSEKPIDQYPIKVSKADHSRENLASKLREALKSQYLEPALTTLKEPVSPPGKKNGNNPYTFKEHDIIGNFTRELKEYIANYSSDATSKIYKDTFRDQKLAKELNQSYQHDLNGIQGGGLNSSYPNTQIGFISNNASEVEQKRVISHLAIELQGDDAEADRGSEEDPVRQKRKSSPLSPGHMLDAAVGHGGNANVTESPDGESSDSSFENSLRQCYEGQELSSRELYPTSYCYSDYSLDQLKVETIQISSDGYYYFIFYSDNDHQQNPIHAHFDIYKTTYQHTNYTRGCINQTECKFPIKFWSNEIVIVEVPTRDGIEHEDGDASVLVSSCYPRMGIYAVFPVAVLFLILVCAFL